MCLCTNYLLDRMVFEACGESMDPYQFYTIEWNTSSQHLIITTDIGTNMKTLRLCCVPHPRFVDVLEELTTTQLYKKLGRELQSTVLYETHSQIPFRVQDVTSQYYNGWSFTHVICRALMFRKYGDINTNIGGGDTDDSDDSDDSDDDDDIDDHIIG